MAGLKFDITGDNGNMLSALQGVQNGVRQTQRVVEQSGQGIEQVFSKIQSAAAAAAGAFSAKELVRNVLEVRGQFQQLEVAFTTMLGSADKANDLMSQLVRTAATTPFDLKSVSEGAKQLLAYGTQADEVNGTLIRLGDIAAGLSIPLNDLVYLYGTTMTQGRMFTQDLRQFQGRGIPIADELAKIFGVTKDKVGELVTAGKVGAAEVQQAIENMTNAGSRFGGLMEAQSHTITGQISNIEDAIDSMFNDIGKANEGVINDALGGVSYLVEHWKEIGQIVLNVAAAYGVAKAAVVAWSTYQKIHNLLMEKAAVQMALAKAEGIAMSEAEAMASVATMGFKNALNALKIAIASNPVGALAVVLTTVFTAMQLLDDETTELATASNKYGESAAKSIQKVKTLSDEVKGLSNSNKTVTTSTKFSKDVLEELNQVLDESGVARIKEGDSIDTVNKKREMAISLIKEEAIERQRLNNIDAGNQAYYDKLKSAREELFKGFSNATVKGVGSDGISDKITQALFGDADKYRRQAQLLTDIFSDTVEEYAPSLARKSGKAYDEALTKMIERIKFKLKNADAGFTDKDINTIMHNLGDGGWFKNSEFISSYIDKVREATSVNYDHIKSSNAVAEAEKRAAEKTLNFSDKVAGISRALQGPNDGVHQLYKNIQKLMEKYKKNTIGFEIQFSGKVPAWMDKMGIPQLSSLAKRFTSLGESLKKGQTMNVNGKIFTKEQLLQRGADYASAMEAKQNKEDAAKNNKNKGKSNPIAEQKKALQEKLNALSYQEAAGRKGAELRRKINALAKKEKVYSSSYDTDNAKEAERKAKEAADKAKRKAEEAARKREYVFESNVTRKNKEEEDAIKAAEAKEEERIASITDAGEKERAAYQLQYDKTIRQVRKEADDLRKAKYDENKRDWDNKNTDKTKVYSDTEEGKKNYKEIKLTTDQESYLQSLISKADKEYTAQRKKWQQEEINTLNEYLKEYGSFEEKKLAITKEYEEKMQNAKSVGEKATLQMQRDKEIEKAKEDNINTSIDWNGIFSDLQGHTKDYLLGLRDQLQDLLSSGNLPIDQMQVVSEKINAIDEELGKQQGIWNFIGEKTREHNRRLKEAADAQERLNVARNQEATEALRLNEVKQEAQKQLSSTGINMSLDEISISSLNGKIDLTDEKFKSMSPILQKLAVAEAKLAEARKNTITATNKAKQAEDGAKEKPAQKIANWFYGKQEFIEDKGIDQLPDLLGSIGLGKAGDKVSKGLDALNSAAGAAGDFASGNYVGAALKGISAIKSFGSMLGIGGGNEKEVARTTERLTKSNEELGKRIDSLSERIGNSAGNKAINAYETALKAQKEINANNMEILKKQMGYHSAHHSNNSYASDSKIASYNGDAQRAFAAAGVDSANITGLSSIYSLSPEQLKAIRDFAPNLWKYLTEVGKYDKKEYWDAVVEQAGKTEKLTEQIKNNLTQTSFDSLRSSFFDTLMDMNADAEDWSNNFAKMLFKSLVNRSVLNDDFDKWLKDFQNKWAKKLSDGDMSQSDYEAYKSEYSKKMEELKKKTDNLASYMGYSDENAAQKATANGVSSITFEQATNIIALTTAGNISRDQTKELVTSIVSNIASLSSFSSSTSATIVEIRNLMITNNSYLEDILKNSKNIYNVFSSKIDDINRNLKELK